MPTSKRGLAGVFKIMENRQKRREEWRIEARVLWQRWHKDPLFILGVALYWGEGHKSGKSPRLALSNSDVAMLQVWLRWCRRFLPGVSLVYYLHVHDHCDPDAARQFWKDQLGVDVTWWGIAVSRASKRKREPNTLPHGTLNVRVSRGSVEWYTKMMVWLDLAQGL
jgi:hypothetical protein